MIQYFWCGNDLFLIELVDRKTVCLLATAETNMPLWLHL